MDMHVLVVDDELLARKRLKNLLKKIDRPIRVSECSNGREALDFLISNQVDMLFLDIQMPELNGFEVLQQLPDSKLPPTIFVTAYDKYAIKAFDVHAIDYLLKPFEDERFYEAFNRLPWPIQETDMSPSSFQQKITHLLEELAKATASTHQIKNQLPQKLIFKQDGKIHFVNAGDINYIKADGKYLLVVTQGTTYKIRQTLLEMEKKLNPEQFLRIQRSTILNVDYIHEMQHWYKGAYVFIMQDGERLISGNSYRKNINWILNQLN